MSQNNRKHGFKLQHWQIINIYLCLFDVFAAALGYFLALWLRFDMRFQSIPTDYFKAYLYYLPIHIVINEIIFYVLKLYKSVWQFASFTELNRMMEAALIGALLHVLGITVIFMRMPISYYVLGQIIEYGLSLAVRFSYRFMLLMRRRDSHISEKKKVNNVMVIGAGSAGQMIVRDEMYARENEGDIVRCIIDDNENKWKRYIDGVPIVGGREDILSAVEKYHIDKILVAIPSASASERRDILTICQETGCEIKNMPGMYQFSTGEITVKNMRDVSIEDLLGREPIKANTEEILQHLSGKVILVTGGGGSIGSELCRQIAAHSPKQLVVFDVYENNAYDLQQEMKYKFPDLNLKVIIGSVRDSRKIFDVMNEYRPNIVFHAAAHKHVPLMEDSPCEAIKNNVFGTYKTALAALACGVDRFLLISTDKAVNPTNIMGASKRLCEMVIQSFDRMVKEGKADQIPILAHISYDDAESLRLSEKIKDGHTEFVAVRFGNVLGSNGSVIPLFKKQIEHGGPVTVTHPDIIRYFMTIPEAVSLVLQSATYAKGGEIFVLDMGEPVKIVDLAKNLIRLSGHEPNKDIMITYTGLRPGEKLYEEKLMSEEGLEKTANKLIHVAKPIDFDPEAFLAKLPGLLNASYANDTEIRKEVAKLVPTYKDPKIVNKTAAKDSLKLYAEERDHN